MATIMTLKITTFIGAILSSISHATKPNYCEPANSSCWPSQSEINTLSQSLCGELLLPSDGIGYSFYVNMTRDTLYTAYPSLIAVCLLAQDIQQSIRFATSHNIQISICSTGRSLSGRNVANNSIQIILSNMTNYKLNLSADTITVETGLQWGPIYEIVNNVNRIIVGGADPGVGPGGYSMLGGHSILSPHYGLSSDYTTEYYIVDAQANIIHVYNTSGINQTIDDLFWSLRGGGGSTYGVVINITFQLHKPIQPIKDNPITAVFCLYDFYEDPIKKQNFVGDIILKNLFQLLQTNQIDEHWGGFVVNIGDAYLLDWFFYGNATYAQQNAQPLFMLNNKSENQNHCEFKSYATFYDIIKRSGNSSSPGGNQYVFNALVPKSNLTHEYAELINEFLNHSTEGWTVGLQAVLQGGAVNERVYNYTSVTPAFRENYFEWLMGAYWNDSNNETIYNNAMDIVHEYEPKLRSYGLGIYSNEENADCIDCDWKYQFWGEHYDKLLSVKQKWDPNQVFWCNHCVGDE